MSKINITLIMTFSQVPRKTMLRSCEVIVYMNLTTKLNVKIFINVNKMTGILHTNL